MGILLVYDVTDEASFNNIRNWMRNIEQHASDNVNKVSLHSCVPQHSACSWSQRSCVQSTAAAGIGVRAVHSTLTAQLCITAQRMQLA
jgi:hypothetical protein